METGRWKELWGKGGGEAESTERKGMWRQRSGRNCGDRDVGRGLREED